MKKGALFKTTFMKHYIVHYGYADKRLARITNSSYHIFKRSNKSSSFITFRTEFRYKKLASKKLEKMQHLVFISRIRKILNILLNLIPIWTEGLVAEFQITEWNPMFGMLGASAEQIEEHLSKK